MGTGERSSPEDCGEGGMTEEQKQTEQDADQAVTDRLIFLMSLADLDD